MRTAVLAALLAALSAPAARAAESSEVIATELARMVMPPSTYEQVIATTTGQMRQMLIPLIQKSAPDADVEELLPLFLEDLQAMMKKLMPTYDDMSAFQAKTFAKHYTPAELRQLRDFYRSPLGQKTIRIMPEVMKDAMEWVQASLVERMPAAMQEFQAAVEPKVREYVRKKEKE